MRTEECGDTSILRIVRRAGDAELHAAFNFSDVAKTSEAGTVRLPAWGFTWMLRG